MTKTTLKIEGMMCEGCVENVTKALEGLDGVESASVDLRRGTAVVMHDGVPNEKLIGAVVDAGFRASVKKGLFS